MSEPMSSVEIEDVLSSIRRLVSDDLRPRAQPPAAPAADKLLLTPALRIVPEGEAEAEEDADPVLRLYPDSDMPRDPQPASPLYDDPQNSQAEAYDDDGAAAAFAEDAMPEAVFAAPEAEPEADPASDPEPLVSAAMARQRDPDPPPASDWADRAEAAIRAELAQHAPSLAEAAATNALPQGQATPDDPVFDEQAMRDLVRDIIREELQGALGERITRNVRKLVRAEIARALAVRDFE